MWSTQYSGKKLIYKNTSRGWFAFTVSIWLLFSCLSFCFTFWDNFFCWSDKNKHLFFTCYLEFCEPTCSDMFLFSWSKIYFIILSMSPLDKEGNFSGKVHSILPVDILSHCSIVSLQWFHGEWIGLIYTMFDNTWGPVGRVIYRSSSVIGSKSMLSNLVRWKMM